MIKINFCEKDYHGKCCFNCRTLVTVLVYWYTYIVEQGNPIEFLKSIDCKQNVSKHLNFSLSSSIGISWDCDLDLDFLTYCKPNYSFRSVRNCIFFYFVCMYFSYW
jgi:hypothetical protein